jgi:hypothetical protein
LGALLLVPAAGRNSDAQDLARYRTYTLGDTVAAVVTNSRVQAVDVKTVHARPRLIQELQWRPEYTETTDPVRTVVFSFVDDALYQIEVAYDRERMAGLTDADVSELLAATYGTPTGKAGGGGIASARVSATTVLAHWTDASNRVTLSKDVDWPLYRLTIVSQPVEARARAAISEALRLDLQEAPQRELDTHRKAAVAAEQARIANKAAFRP